MKLIKRFPFLPTIVVLIAIAYLSLAERPVDTDTMLLFEGADKVVHGCMYMGLVWIGCCDLYRIVERIVPLYWGIMILVAVAWGGAMEWLQGVVTEERSADVIDFIANCCGAFLGLILAIVVVPRLFRRWLS